MYGRSPRGAPQSGSGGGASPCEAAVERVTDRLLAWVVVQVVAEPVRGVRESHLRVGVGERERSAGARVAERPAARSERKALGGLDEAGRVRHRHSEHEIVIVLRR